MWRWRAALGDYEGIPSGSERLPVPHWTGISSSSSSSSYPPPTRLDAPSRRSLPLRTGVFPPLALLLVLSLSRCSSSLATLPHSSCPSCCSSSCEKAGRRSGDDFVPAAPSKSAPAPAPVAEQASSSSRAVGWHRQSCFASVTLLWQVARRKPDMAAPMLGYSLACRYRLPAGSLVTA